MAKQLVAELPRVAVAAARAADTDDAVRLWGTVSNLDRRHLSPLAELALTKAREPLRLMYERMKREDPHTYVPDLALRLLQ